MQRSKHAGPESGSKYLSHPQKNQEITSFFVQKNKKKPIVFKTALIAVYTWLKTLNLLPNDLDSLSGNELKVISKRTSSTQKMFEMFY